MNTKRILLVLVGLSLLAAADDHKLSKDLRSNHSTAAINVIVQFKSGLSQRQKDTITQHGGSVDEELHLVRALKASLSGSKLADLAKDRDVAYISPDRSVRSYLNNAAVAVNAPVSWNLGYTGSGIGVAVIDSGVSPANGDLGSKVVYSASFLPGSSSAADGFGHGTHVAGIIAGSGAESSGSKYVKNFTGIAPGAHLINLRALDANGAGTDSSVIAAIQAAVQLKAKYNIRIINLSLGRPVYESYTKDPLCQAVEQAYRAGVMVVVAAGNDGRNNSAGTNGYGTITAPANDPYVITVGAMKSMGTGTRSDDRIASYSSKGPTLIDHVVKPDIIAPGNQITSLGAKGTLAQEYPSNHILQGSYSASGNSHADKGYFLLSGTSMAAAVVSGGVADVLQARPALTPDQLKALLMKSAYKVFPNFSNVTDTVTGMTYTSQYDVFTVGAGYLDLQAALANSDPLPSGSAVSPTAAYDASCDCVHFLNDSSAMWGNSAIWGGSGLWGSSALWGVNVFVGQQSAIWGSSALWGTSAIWGSNTPSAFGALWGSSAMWGTSTTSSSEGLSLSINGE